MLNNLNFSLDDLEFSGLKFRKSETHTEAYFNQLLEDGTHYSKVKFLEGFNEQFADSIHVKLSWYYLLITVSLTLLSVGIFILFQQFFFASAIFILLSGIIWFIGWLFLRSARKENRAMAMNASFIDLIFEDHRKKIEAEEDKGED